MQGPSIEPRHRHTWHYTFVEKTTVYLPDDLNAAIKRAAAL
jgi:hypothetical protein